MNGTNPQQIDARDVNKKIQEYQSDFVLIDVRTPEEFSRSRITNSINVPVDEIEAKIVTVVPNKDTFVIVYCLSGNRSKQGMEIMFKLGYKNVKEITSGLMAWRVYKLPEEI
jgi:rhodanese-related sulfurtransferase